MSLGMFFTIFPIVNMSHTIMGNRCRNNIINIYNKFNIRKYKYRY